MAASLSRPDPSSPAAVAEAGFSTARRGYAPDEVRAFLVSVAAELGRLQERERQLEAELREARSVDPDAAQLDEATVEKMLGEETLRVLQTARESASQIKIRAEENAARVIGDANDEANRLRQDAEIEAARRRQDAAADAEGEVALAKQQGREMVNEARSYRERVLADLERRTTLARKQIEDLMNGRDRLLQAFERARLVAVDVTAELQAIEAPTELVNLDPTTGPVPLMVPSERPGRVVETDGEPVDDVAPDAGDVDTGDVDTGDVDTGDRAQEADEGASGEVDVEAESDGPREDEPAAAASVRDADTNVVSLFRGRDPAEEAADADDETDAPEAGEAGDRADVDGIFERLRSEVPAGDVVVTGDGDVQAEDGADDADGANGADDADDADGADGAPEAEPTAFSRRDEALVPLIVSAARKLKRVLADEQNGVLDALRQKEPVTALDAVVPDLDAHVARYAEAIDEELIDAAAAGATELGVNDTKTLRRKMTKAGALEPAHTVLRRDLLSPLRDRLERSIADGDGDNDDITKRVRAVYREWKTQHIDDQLDDVFRFAHGGGLAATAQPGTPLEWVIDPREPACPDCEDNSLAGPVAAGEQYPTGHTAAPAHPGCRCLTLPASG